MQSEEQFSLFGGRAEKDAAMARVQVNSGSWFDSAMAAIALLPRGWTGTGEDLRLLLTPTNGTPHHHNAWGALTAQAVKRGYLRRTGLRTALKVRTSHARQTDIYVRS